MAGGWGALVSTAIEVGSTAAQAEADRRRRKREARRERKRQEREDAKEAKRLEREERREGIVVAPKSGGMSGRAMGMIAAAVLIPLTIGGIVVGWLVSRPKKGK